MSPEEIQQKEVEFYAAGLNAWYNTRLEHDKSLLTLSAGGIGLIITLLTTIGVTSSEALVLNIVAILCFLICLFSILAIFKKNSSHLERVIQGENLPDFLLGILDKVSNYSFILGVIFSVIIGISVAITSYSSKEKTMVHDEKPQANTTRITVGDSFNNIAALKPSSITPQSSNTGTSPSTTGTGSTTTSSNVLTNATNSSSKK
jgi:hypothetical protein